MDLNELRTAHEVGVERQIWEERLQGVFLAVATTASDARRALEDPSCDEPALRQVMRSLRGQLVELLRMQEVELVGRTGEEADPARHCIRKKVSSQEPANCVVAVEREGVRWEGRLLRAADVTISGGLDAVV